MIVRTVLRGLGASPGIAVGRALVVREAAASVAPPDVGTALAALAQAAAELNAAATDLRRRGLADEAEILETNCLMAEDPVLAAGVRAVGVELSPADALRAATEEHARLLAGLPDERLLAARAADVRELGRRAARIADRSRRPPFWTATRFSSRASWARPRLRSSTSARAGSLRSRSRRAPRRRTPRSSPARWACRWRSPSAAS